MISCLVSTRNCLVSNYGVNINYIYNKHGVVNVQKSSLYYLFKCLTYACCIPFNCIKSCFVPRYNIIYNMDKLYYTTDTEYTKIAPIILSVKAYKKDIPIYQPSPTNIYNKLTIDTSTPSNDIPVCVNNLETKNNTAQETKTEEPNTQDTKIEIKPEENITQEVEQEIEQEIEQQVEETKIDEDKLIDITQDFKVFNNLIPLWIFIKVTRLNLNKYDTMQFTYLLNAKMNTREININEMKDVQLYKLFI